jgi:hypothetical protein
LWLQCCAEPQKERPQPSEALEASGYWAIRSGVCKTFERSKDPELEVWDGINHRLNSAIDKILARKASTVEGLSVQARATVLAAAELWDLVSDDELSHERLFIEATCSFLGLDARRIADGALPAGPVVAASIDPIFGKIEKFKTACDRLDAVCGREPLFGSPECTAWKAEEAQALDLLSEAEMDLISTQPVTRSGAAAVLRIFLDFNKDCAIDERARPLLKTIRDYLESSRT